MKEYLIITWDGDMIHTIVCFTEKQAIRRNGTFTLAFTSALKQAYLDSTNFRVQIEIKKGTL